ncbi:MAG: hypothetical protein AAGA92_05995 [Planctomycetota bacterium]
MILFVFLITDQVDDQGYFILTNHHKISLQMSSVTECSLPPGYGGDILDQLVIEKIGGATKVSFCSAVDPKQGWHILCEEVKVADVESCGSRK